MKRIALFVAVCLLFLVSIGHADEAARKTKAEELMGLMKVKETVEQSFQVMKQMIPMQLQQMGVTPADAAEKEKAMKLTMDIMAEEMSWEKIKDDMVAVYAEILSEEELDGLIAFFGTPVGKSWIDKQPQLTARSMQLSQMRMMKIMPMIKQKVEEMKAMKTGQ